MTTKVLVGVCGGIAAYKLCEVVSNLAQRSDRLGQDIENQDEEAQVKVQQQEIQQIEVQVVVSQSATQFVNPLTFATLSRHAAYTDADFWQPSHGKPLHIQLAEWADLILIAPLTANTLAKLVWGMADNLLTNVVLASDCPILVAPAMNTTMWLQEIVQNNWHSLLKNNRYQVISPQSGRLACDSVGMGRMAEPQQILARLDSLIWTRGKRDLLGKKILVSAGATREYLDAVRFLSNPATGKQGIAIAQAAHDRGAEVTLVLAGNLAENLPFPVIRVDTAAQMQESLHYYFVASDLTIMTAAVGDLRPKFCSNRKLSKAEIPLKLELELVPDIIQGLSQIKKDRQILVGFAAQTGSLAEMVKLGQQKLVAKGLEAIVINSVNLADKQTGFGSETNQAVFRHKDGRELQTPLCSKLELAHRLFDFLFSD